MWISLLFYHTYIIENVLFRFMTEVAIKLSECTVNKHFVILQVFLRKTMTSLPSHDLRLV